MALAFSQSPRAPAPWQAVDVNSPVTAQQTRTRVRRRMPVQATRWCLPSRMYAAMGRYRPIDIDRTASDILQENLLLRFRPVRPAHSAWHEMPGYGFPELRRPVRQFFVSTRSVTGGTPGGCVRGAVVESRVTTRRVRGAELRTGLTGRKGCKAGGPGISSRAGGTGLTGRNRKSRSPAERPISLALTQSSQKSAMASGGCQSPGNSPLSFRHRRSRIAPGWYRPIDIDRSPSGTGILPSGGVGRARLGW
jgi:hypothetical protein